MNNQMNIEVHWGSTLQSGKMFTTNEPLPPGISYQELMDGIADGTYSLKSLAGKTFKGQIRERANAVLKAELVISTDANMLSFSVPASIIKTWPNEKLTYYYDLYETETSTGIVKLRAQGQVNIKPAMTKEA